MRYLRDCFVDSQQTFQINIQAIDKNTIDEINLLSESVHLTKDLVNEPVSYLTATQYAKDIQQLGKNAGFKVTVWNQKKIEQEKMGGLIAVNRGSSAPAAFIILEYKPTKSINKKPLVLVGKGVVYDTGGLSLKPTKNIADRYVHLTNNAVQKNSKNYGVLYEGNQTSLEQL